MATVPMDRTVTRPFYRPPERYALGKPRQSKDKTIYCRHCRGYGEHRDMSHCMKYWRQQAQKRMVWIEQIARRTETADDVETVGALARRFARRCRVG